MLKVVVFDNGFGGELFADRLERELSIVEIIRVIDWHDAENTADDFRAARKAAERALRPYLGRVDLIVIANYLLSVTSLKHFRQKYPNQKFVGFALSTRRIAKDKPTLIITTTPTTKNLAFFAFAARTHAKTVCLDTWPQMIEEGRLLGQHLKNDAAIQRAIRFSPEQILLACGQFTSLEPVFRQVFGHNVRIIDGFDQAFSDTCRALRLRGGTGKKIK